MYSGTAWQWRRTQGRRSRSSMRTDVQSIRPSFHGSTIMIIIIVIMVIILIVIVIMTIVVIVIIKRTDVRLTQPSFYDSFITIIHNTYNTLLSLKSYKFMTIMPNRFTPDGTALQSVYEAFRFTESYGVTLYHHHHPPSQSSSSIS